MFVYFCYATHSVTKNVYDVYDFVNGAEFEHTVRDLLYTATILNTVSLSNSNLFTDKKIHGMYTCLQQKALHFCLSFIYKLAQNVK